jgi:hypothetical protein
VAAAVEIVPVESARGRLSNLFIGLPHSIYRGSPYWVPQFDRDVREILARRHPFFEKGAAAFFLALRAGKPVGTIAAIDNARSRALSASG